MIHRNHILSKVSMENLTCFVRNEKNILDELNISHLKRRVLLIVCCTNLSWGSGTSDLLVKIIEEKIVLTGEVRLGGLTRSDAIARPAAKPHFGEKISSPTWNKDNDECFGHCWSVVMMYPPWRHRANSCAPLIEHCWCFQINAWWRYYFTFMSG